jgi:hypothetical protein
MPGYLAVRWARRRRVPLSAQPSEPVPARDLCAIHHAGDGPLVTSRVDGRKVSVDRCALFVDAGYVLADGAMAVHGTRNRDSVTWDYAGVLQFLGNVARDRTGLPLLRCYWYEATVESRRTPEHDALADLPGVKLRLGRMRPGHREGVESEIHRDLTTLARNSAITDALMVSAEEDLAQVIAEVQDLGIRVTILHVTVDGNWTISRALRQECDDIVEIGEAHLRPYVELVVGAEPVREDEREAIGAYAARAPANGHGAIGSLGQQALPAGSHSGAPAIYTAPVVADYQRAAQPAPAQPGFGRPGTGQAQSNGQHAPTPAAGDTDGGERGRGGAPLPRRETAGPGGQSGQPGAPGQSRAALPGGERADASGPGQPAAPGQPGGLGQQGIPGQRGTSGQQGGPGQAMGQAPSTEAASQHPAGAAPHASMPQQVQLPMGGQPPGQHPQGGQSLPAPAHAQFGMPPASAPGQQGGLAGHQDGMAGHQDGLPGQPSGLGMPQQAPPQPGHSQPGQPQPPQPGQPQPPQPGLPQLAAPLQALPPPGSAQQSVGHQSVGQHAAAQSPAAQSPAGQSPAGQSPAGQSPAGQHQGGQHAQPMYQAAPTGGGFRGAAQDGAQPSHPLQVPGQHPAGAHAGPVSSAPGHHGQMQPAPASPGQLPQAQTAPAHAAPGHAVPSQAVPSQAVPGQVSAAQVQPGPAQGAAPQQQMMPGPMQPGHMRPGAPQGLPPSGFARPGMVQPGPGPVPGQQPAGMPQGQLLAGPGAQVATGSAAPAGQQLRAGQRPYPPGQAARYGGQLEPRPGRQFPGAPAGQQEGAGGQQAYVPQQGPHSGPQPTASPAPVPPPVAVSLADAVQAAHGEGFNFGQTVARDAPALWLEAVLARKPRMPSDLEARLLQDSALPIDSLLHDEVRHALRRGFWDALERSRH